MHYVYLAIAIVAEVTATTNLKSAEGFTRLGPSLIVIAGYAVAFLCMSLSMQKIQIGIVYAIWAGAGIVLIAIAGYFIHNQRLDPPAILGMVLIVAGVVIIQTLSKTATAVE